MKRILGIEAIKNNKFYFVCKIIFSLVFAAVITLDSLLVFHNTIDGGINDIYFKEVGIVNILIFIVATVLTYIVISLIEIGADKIEGTVYTKKERKSKNIKVFFIVFAIILLCWLPTILSYFPGGIYSDTVASIRQAIKTTGLNNANPILYAYILKAFIAIGGGLQNGIGLFTVFQILIFAAAVAYSVYWLYKKDISIKYVALTTAFFAICRLLPMYAISIWKDTPFCIALFMYTLFILETIYQDGENLQKIRNVILYVFLAVLVCFLRSNGFYVVVATTFIMFIVYRKNIFKNLKIFTIVSLVSIIITYVVQGPVFNHLGWNEKKAVESFGVPIQQLSYVVSKENGNITPEQLEFINGLMPIEKIKETYYPCLVDKIKWDAQFNNSYLEDNKTQFLKVWLKVLLQNPGSYVKAYLLNTIGFWDINKATMDAYINPQMWHNNNKIKIEENEIVEQTDYIEKVTGHSIKSILTPSIPVSSAVFLFIALLSALITIYKKKYKNLLIYIPALLTWATIMIAAPLAFSLRYVYILVLIMPLCFFIPFLKQKNTDRKEEE